jgi:hypothetical protein
VSLLWYESARNTIYNMQNVASSTVFFASAALTGGVDRPCAALPVRPAMP